MDESNKRSNQTFLQKFKGRTNKIDKNGINFALDPLLAQQQSPSVRSHLSNTRNSKLSGIHSQNIGFDLKERFSNIDINVNKNRQAKYLDPITTKRSANTKILSKRIDYLPPLLPMKSPASVKKNISYDQQSNPPPSRHASDKSETSKHRIFGKYLKLDDQALKHFEFLMQIDKKRQMRKNSAIFSDR